MMEFEKFKEIFNNLDGEPEITIKYQDDSSNYMIIKYNNYVTYQKCGIDAIETKYNSIDELYENILKNNWNKITNIIIDEGIDLINNKADYIESEKKEIKMRTKKDLD